MPTQHGGLSSLIQGRCCNSFINFLEGTTDRESHPQHRLCRRTWLSAARLPLLRGADEHFVRSLGPPPRDACQVRRTEEEEEEEVCDATAAAEALPKAKASYANARAEWGEGAYIKASKVPHELFIFYRTVLSELPILRLSNIGRSSTL